MAKNTGFCFRELGSASCIHMVAQTIFKSNPRDMISSSHLCIFIHICGHVCMHVYMCICRGYMYYTKQKASESLITCWVLKIFKRYIC